MSSASSFPQVARYTCVRERLDILTMGLQIAQSTIETVFERPLHFQSPFQIVMKRGCLRAEVLWGV